MPSNRFPFPPALPLLLSLTLGACSTPGERPALPRIDTAVTFSTDAPAGDATRAWWDVALDAALRNDIAQLLANNPQIRIAATQVAADRARLDAAEAERWLDIGASAGSSVQVNDGSGSDSHDAGIDASLPLDLFGRLRLTRDAAAFDLAQSMAQLEQARLQQVQAYLLARIDAAEAARLQALLQEQIDTAQTLLRLIELRFAQGLVSSVDVLQQRQQLASLRRQQPAAALALRQARNRASELLGNAPPADAGAPALPTIDPQVAGATPADLLQRRPDLLAQRAALAAQDSRYEAALRARLPSASLSASALLRLASSDPSAILGAAIDASASLFDSGRLAAASAQQAALLRQQGVRYLQSWLQALRETDDLLNQAAADSEQLARSLVVSDASQALFEASRRRYERGISDYLPVLGALRSLQQQQRDHLALEAEQQRTLVRLHTALGLPRASQQAPEQP